MAANPMCKAHFFASAFRRRAAYGNRTRLLGLGSRCTTDVLMPQNRLQKYNIFCILANICRFFCIIEKKVVILQHKISEFYACIVNQW